MFTIPIVIRKSVLSPVAIACAIACMLTLVPSQLAFAQADAGPVVAAPPQPPPAPAPRRAPQQPAAQPQAEESTPGPGAIRVDVNLTLVDVTMRKPAGEVITGLRVTDFVLQEDGQTQQVVHLDQHQLPLAMALVIDLSTSISPYLESLKDTTEVALQSLKPEDQVALFTFTDELTKVVPLTRDKQKVSDALDTLQAGGSTNINDALYGAAEYLRANAHGMRRVIVLISDNVGTRAGSTTPDGVLQAVLESDTPVYSLKVYGEHGGGYQHGGHGGGGYPGGGGRGGGGGWPGGGGGQPQANSKDIVNVQKVADASGGEVFDVKKEGSLDKAFQDLMDRLKTRYTIGYYSSNKSTAGGYRKIDVSLISRFGKPGKDYTVTAKQGYYAPLTTASAGTGTP